MTEWLRLATRPSVMRRAVRYALGVGAILITINHGDAIVRGDVSTGRVLRMLLTVLVPYCVSTASAVGAAPGSQAIAAITDRRRRRGIIGDGQAPTIYDVSDACVGYAHSIRLN